MSKKTRAERAARAYADTTGTSYQKALQWAESGFRHSLSPGDETRQDVPADESGRAAQLCSEATGWSPEECAIWAEQRFISVDRPVPDGLSPAQRSLEAYAVNVLSAAFCDSQLESNIFGITRVSPLPSGPVLYLQPEMADAAVAALLPRYESGFGGVKGIPGLRPDPSVQGALSLRLTGTRAHIQLRSERSNWRPELPVDRLDGAGEGVRQLWTSGDALDPLEEERLDRWDNWPTSRTTERVERNWLLSRLLRRAALVNVAGASHGWANTYTHTYEDLVIEWCCGIDPSEMQSRLVRSGLLVPPPRLTLQAQVSPAYPGTLRLGSGRAYVVRRSNCAISDEVARQVRELLRREFTK